MFASTETIARRVANLGVHSHVPRPTSHAPKRHFMPIEGPLKELGLHDVFQLLDLSRKTGIMRVTSHLRNNEGMVGFDGGAIIYAEIRSSPVRIGELLVRAGRITEEELERARALQQQE